MTAFKLRYYSVGFTFKNFDLPLLPILKRQENIHKRQKPPPLVIVTFPEGHFSTCSYMTVIYNLFPFLKPFLQICLTTYLVTYIIMLFY